ncbi:MAG: 4-hydroxy-tetrahydrodipicolinate synthase [Deltaproteobacteria bacterium]|nr:4-hydroxy-tetrahydrodipicolinate synthase [Deltaproteobacteria bacterium]
MAVQFRGAMTALITPFRDGAFDRDAMAGLIEQQLGAGIDGLVPCGTTGEGATLTLDEHRTVVRFVVEQVRGRVPVIGGAGSNNTHHAIELQKLVKEAGADGALQVTPYYNKPNQRGLVAHFRAVVDACPLPTLLYNVPGRTGCDLQPRSVSELAQHPSIVGIKEATGLAARAQEILNLVPPDFAVLSGEDAVILPLLAIGGHGVISVVSHVAPAAVAGLCDAAQQNDAVTARRLARQLAPLARLLFVDTNPIPVKTACAALGLCREELRLPLVAMEPADRDRFVADLRAIGVAGLR